MSVWAKSLPLNNSGSPNAFVSAYTISEANRIFGFDGWNRETVESRCVLTRENRGPFIAVYTAKVRITGPRHAVSIARRGHGPGECRGTSHGEVHDIAL